MELLFVLFLCGFAAATLIFWPLLNRANKRSAEGRSPQRGRHALGTPSAPAATTAASTRTTGSTTASASTSENAAAGPEEGTEEETGGESTQPVSVDAPPERREPEEVEMPDLPTDLFETRYQAKFNRPKRRLERIKAEVGRME